MQTWHLYYLLVIISNRYNKIVRILIQWCWAPLTTILLIYLHLAAIQVSLDWRFFDLFGPDKWVHLGMFLFLTWSWRCHLTWKHLHPLIWFSILCSFGFFLEHLQTWFTTYRSEEWADALADMLGVLMAFALFRMRIFSRLILSHENREYDIGKKDNT